MKDMTPDTRHTPGPWAANKDGKVCAPDTKEWSRTFNAEIPAYVCTTGGPAYSANARLIAAAPDMLAALKDLLDHYGLAMTLLGREHSGFEGSSEVMAARAAIARATGQEVRP